MAALRPVAPALAQLATPPPVRPEPPAPIKLIEPGPAVPDWPGYNYDQQRTGWNRARTSCRRKTVAGSCRCGIRQLLNNPPALVLSTLTAPVVAGGVSTPGGAKDLVFTIGMDDVLRAVDADSGAIVWQKSFPNPIKPLRPPSISCSNTEQATPIIDKAKGVIYFTTSDGKLRGAKLGDGSEAIRPTDMVQPFSRNWSLNLVDDVVYTTTARGCGGSPAQPVEFGTVAAMDVSDPDPSRRCRASIPARAVPPVPGAPAASPGDRKAPMSPPPMAPTIPAAASMATWCWRFARMPGA